MKLSFGCHEAFKNTSIEQEGELFIIRSPKMVRSDYEQFKKVVHGLRGEWIRKKDAHVFWSNPTQEIESIVETGLAPEYISNPYSFFPTPIEEVRDIVWVLARVQDFVTCRIAETGAGDGRFIQEALRACPQADIHYWEIDERNRQILEPMNATLQGEDFLSSNIDSLKGLFDFVLMNPEFNKKAYQKHVKKSFELLKVGGTLISIMPATAITDRKFRDWLFQDGRGTWYNGEHEFADTKISYIVVELRNCPDIEPPYGAETWDEYYGVMALNSDYEFYRGLWGLEGKVRTPKITTLEALHRHIEASIDRIVRQECVALCLDPETLRRISKNYEEELGLKGEPIAQQLTLC
jgi:hypothetical protein